ncbi:Nucleolar protein 4-like [Larimichthys crocea]|uniref:Nucleolar protein 4-like n=1 Tax=Larimichthys crocea TaxID=215358 RepID=A0A6G0IM96_LARCR|nr:Nucleolar protein 4-like [Larimichthys crocea]
MEESRQESREESREESRQESREESREESRQESREESRQESREESREESRQESREESRQESREESREESRQENRQESRQESREESRQESREERQEEAGGGRQESREESRQGAGRRPEAATRALKTSSIFRYLYQEQDSYDNTELKTEETEGKRVNDEDSSSESGSGNGLPALTPPSSAVVREAEVVNGNGGPAPLDFSTPTSSSSSSEDQQPMNLSDPPPPRLPLSTSHLPVTVSAAAAALLGALHPNAPEELRRKYPLAAKPPQAPHPALPLPHTHTLHTHNAHTPNTHSQSHTHAAELRLDRDGRDYGGKSPQYSSGGSYDSVKMDLSAEDLTMGRHGSQVAPDDDDDDHDDHDDNDKINDAEGVDPERLKAFNMFVRLFVDENLDRMVPISKQPKEKIQAIIESCSRQFPEFQERARKRIRTYLKSCRRMKKNGMETRPTPPHLTSAMAENILAAACENESRNAAKRMRLEAYHDEQISLDKPCSGGGGLREPASLAHSAYSLAASAFSRTPSSTSTEPDSATVTVDTRA